MKAKSVVAGLVAAGAMVLLGSVGASANVVWCMFDPPAQVVTPGGHNITVSNTVYLPADAASLKNNVSSSAVATADGTGGTLITETVVLPEQGRVVASVQKYKVSSEAVGGPVLTLYLHIPIS